MDCMSNEEFKKTERLYTKYKKLIEFKEEIEKAYNENLNKKTNILDDEYMELLEYEYSVINSYIKSNSKGNERINDIKYSIIRILCDIENEKNLKILKGIMEVLLK